MKVTWFFRSSRKISLPSREIISLSLRLTIGSVHFSARWPIMAFVTGDRSSKQYFIRSLIAALSGTHAGFRSPEQEIVLSEVSPIRSITNFDSVSSFEVKRATQSPGRNSRDPSRSIRVASGTSSTISQHCFVAIYRSKSLGTIHTQCDSNVTLF